MMYSWYLKVLKYSVCTMQLYLITVFWGLLRPHMSLIIANLVIAYWLHSFAVDYLFDYTT